MLQLFLKELIRFPLKEVTQPFTHFERGDTVFHLFLKDSFGHSLVHRQHSLQDLTFLKEVH